VKGVEIELPVIDSSEYKRAAPGNYNIPMPTKRVAIPCPYHGYRCGMQRTVEDLVGHLQEVHDVELETANLIGRENWKDLHDDIHWELETKEKSGCPGGVCPTNRRRGLFSRGLFR
jgi:hypothetical protein